MVSSLRGSAHIAACAKRHLLGGFPEQDGLSVCSRPHKEREISEALYREALAVVGYDLTEADGLPDELIADAARRMGCRAPSALREF